MIPIKFRSRIIKTAGCWFWKGSRRKVMLQIHGRRQYVSRWMWEWTKGKIPSGKEVCHKCDVPGCIRPTHFFLGTHLENMRDCVAKGRHATIGKYKGEAHGMHKLTNAQVLVIRDETGTLREIGRRYRVNPSLVWKIKNRHNWRHL